MGGFIFGKGFQQLASVDHLTSTGYQSQTKLAAAGSEWSACFMFAAKAYVRKSYYGTGLPRKTTEKIWDLKSFKVNFKH